jgi:hypothetical protein
VSAPLPWRRACDCAQGAESQEASMSIATRHREPYAARPLAALVATLSLAFTAACDDNSGKTGSTNAPREERRAESTPPSSPPQTQPSTPSTPSTPRATPERPPAASPGAGPSGAKLIGTWTVTEFKGGPADGRSDRSETTTYRFEEGGRVTVAGNKQCAYALQDMELKVDCNGQVTGGKIEFRGDQTMLWSVGREQIVTLTKR